MKVLSPAQIANAALQLISKAEVKADDDSLEVATQVRNFLKAIAAGKIVVSLAAPAGPDPGQDPQAS